MTPTPAPVVTGPRRSAKPTVTLDPIAEKLAIVGLDYPASCLPELVEEATRDGLTPLAFLDHLLTRQLERKDERRVATMLKLSGLPPGKTLEDFDWTFEPRADRRQIEALATCSYLREKTNMLFLGPPGVGRSHLATALGGEGDQERLLGGSLRPG
jgi:DNA replication protein DnaC